MNTKTRLTIAAAGLLLATPVLAEDTTAAAQQTMREAMQERMGVPAAQATMPGEAPGSTSMPDHASPTTGAGHHQAATEAGHRARNQMQHQVQAQRQAEQHARHGGMRQADPTRAEAANGAAMGAGMSSAMMGGNDTCQAADQQRTQKMHPGGMMPGGGGSGGGMMTP